MTNNICTFNIEKKRRGKSQVL